MTTLIGKLYVLIFASLVHKFHPVSAIINDSLRITKEAAEKAFRDAENEPASQVKDSCPFVCFYNSKESYVVSTAQTL